MVGDSGYPNLWRRYVNAANFADAGICITNLASDIANLHHQNALTESTGPVVEKAASATRDYLYSLSMFKRDGDADLRDAAMAAIDEMEVALQSAVGRHD